MKARGGRDWLAAPFLRNEDLRVKGGRLPAAFGDGGIGLVAIVMLDPFEERFAGRGRDRRASGRRHA
ncbi:hypothetical protein [Sphingobium cupriresistens]|uniref:hypothetical protein n=1 Tax=Sphingobium cupriresistens TaxID=1132417 RepID=UPI003BF55BDC